MHSIAHASWFLPHKYVHVYFCRVFYVYVSFSFYETFLLFPIMSVRSFVR
jgi:hypothetical protein